MSGPILSSAVNAIAYSPADNTLYWVQANITLYSVSTSGDAIELGMLNHSVADLAVRMGTAPCVTGTDLRGDANGDGTVDISDAIFTFAALFIPGSPSGNCDDAADVNVDGAKDVRCGLLARRTVRSG